MTALSIIPNYDKKRLKLVGTVAAGEHVDVTVVGGMEWVSPDEESQTLRLRVLAGGRTVAEFPHWTSENYDDWPDGVTEPDGWDTTSEDPTCELVLNTVQAEKILRLGGETLWVLDDAANHTLYGVGEFHVEAWPKNRPNDVPYNLDGYLDFVEDAKAAIQAAQSAISDFFITIPPLAFRLFYVEHYFCDGRCSGGAYLSTRARNVSIRKLTSTGGAQLAPPRPEPRIVSPEA